MTLKELAVVLRLEASQFQTGIKNAANSVEQFGSSMNKSQSACSILANSMRALGGDVKAGFTAAMSVSANIVNTAFDIIKKATLGLTGILTGAIIESSRFGESIDRAWRQAADGAERTGKEYEKFKQTAIDIGKTSLFSAIDVAKAMALIADRSRNVTQTEEEVAWATKLAAATGTDLSTSADSIARSMMIFSKQGLTASQAANYLAVMSDKGAIGLNEMGMAFRTLMPLAASMGWGFKDIGTVLGVLSTKGIEGMRAIFALQSILSSTLDPTQGLGKELANVGVEVVDTSGKVMPLLNIIKQFQKLGWSTQDVFKRFGDQLSVVFSTIAETGPQAFNEFSDAMYIASLGSETYVDEQEEMFKKTLPGALKALSSAADTQLTAIGDSFAKELVPVLGTFKEWINQIGEAISKSGILSSVVTLLTTALAPAKEGIDALIKSLSEWMKNITAEDIKKGFAGVTEYVNTAASAVKSLAENLDKVVKFFSFIIAHAPMMAGIAIGSKFGPWGTAIGAGTGLLAEAGIKAGVIGPSAPLKVPEKGSLDYQYAIARAMAGQMGAGMPLTLPTELSTPGTALQNSLSKQSDTQAQLVDVIVKYAEQMVTISTDSTDELDAKLNNLIKGMKDKTSKPQPATSIY